MTRDDDFIGKLEGYLDEFEGLTPLPDDIRTEVRARLATTKQLALLGGFARRFPTMSSNTVRYAIAGAVVVLVVIVSTQFVRGLNLGGTGQTSTPVPTASAAPSACLESSAAPVADASPGDLTWGPERATQDWPGALRAEPPGCALVIDVPATEPAPGAGISKAYSDPHGDGTPAALAMVDIVSVEVRECGWFSPSVCVFFTPAAIAEPMPSPADQWIAYGIVVDATGDGRPERRFGIDNAAGDAGRMWRTDLATGTTYAPVLLEDPGVMDAVFPTTVEPTGGSIFAKYDTCVFRLYVWASVISDGRIVSTDFAPDVGWLEWGVC